MHIGTHTHTRYTQTHMYTHTCMFVYTCAHTRVHLHARMHLHENMSAGTERRRNGAERRRNGAERRRNGAKKNINTENMNTNHMYTKNKMAIEEGESELHRGRRRSLTGVARREEAIIGTTLIVRACVCVCAHMCV